MKQFAKLLTFSFLIASSISVSAKKLNILIVAGGHDFDRKSFFEMFDSFQYLSYKLLKLGKGLVFLHHSQCSYQLPETC